MNGVDAVVLATGNDFRAVEAGVHVFAARQGAYRPVSRWTCSAEALHGEAEFPLALGIVGGTLGVHPAARLALRVARVGSASDLMELVASAGLASNLAALRALATEGIQRGHMSLHARAVASSVGARGDEVERVAAVLASSRVVTREAAAEALHHLRRS
jgi:hydroxymethylglutaryl-CoA reductase